MKRRCRVSPCSAWSRRRSRAMGRQRRCAAITCLRSRWTRRHLSSVAMDVTAIAAAVRAHWRIENCPHWVLDIGFDEDRARNRRDHGPENLTTLRKLALNVLRTAGQTSRSGGNASAPVGPMSSPAPRSVKCDSSATRREPLWTRAAHGAMVRPNPTPSPPAVPRPHSPRLPSHACIPPDAQHVSVEQTGPEQTGRNRPVRAGWSLTDRSMAGRPQ
jgi:predicted transposase YbfD/YdcC